MSYEYLASPYQNPDNPADTAYCEARFQEVCAAAAILMAQGRRIFCPIAHSHPIAAHLDPALRTSHDFWLKQDFAMLDGAARLLVLMLYQWKRSYGIGREIIRAHARGIPVEYIEAV